MLKKLLLALCIGVIVNGASSDVALLVLIASSALFVIGWWDDVAPFAALAKMVNALAVAAAFIFTLGYIHNSRPEAVFAVLGILWFGGIVNAVNLLDNMDGLCAGIAILDPGASPHPPHRHPEEEFLIIAAGTGQIECAGDTTEVGPGAMMYCAGNTLHGIVNTGKLPMTFYWSKWLAKST